MNADSDSLEQVIADIRELAATQNMVRAAIYNEWADRLAALRELAATQNMVRAAIYNEWADRLAALPRAEWRDISTAPKDGSTWFLAASRNGFTVEVVRFDGAKNGDDKEYWFDGKGYYRINDFTHWMPLPPPPAKEST